MIKRYASHYLYSSASKVYKYQIVELGDGLLLQFYPLCEEFYSVFWLGGVIVLSAEPDYKINNEMSFHELIVSLTSGLLSDRPVYVYLLGGIDLQTKAFLPDLFLKRLD